MGENKQDETVSSAQQPEANKDCGPGVHPGWPGYPGGPGFAGWYPPYGWGGPNMGHAGPNQGGGQQGRGGSEQPSYDPRYCHCQRPSGQHHAGHAPYPGTPPPPYAPYPGTPPPPYGSYPGTPPPPYGYGPQPAKGFDPSSMVEQLIKSPASFIGQLFDMDNPEFWKGALIGAAAILLLNGKLGAVGAAPPTSAADAKPVGD